MQICHAAVESGSCKNYRTLLYFIATIDWPLLGPLVFLYLGLIFGKTALRSHCSDSLLLKYNVNDHIYTHAHASVRVLLTMFVI